MSAETKDYLLGVNDAELQRLRFQHHVWKPISDDFFRRIGIQPGWRCLDVGAGPGSVSLDLARIVGETGEITALEPSSLYLDTLRDETQRLMISNIQPLRGTVENTHLPSDYYDLIFVRWVIGFSPNPVAFLAPLARALRAGGIIAIQDYLYEGLSLFPRGGPFDEMPGTVRAYYKSVGGDPFIAANLPVLLRSENLELIDYSPHCLAGGPDSDIIEWAHRFFTVHIQLMVHKRVVTQEKGNAMLEDWLEHRNNPDTIFVSPIVVDVAAKRV